jgi:6-phosphogluconolactonase/glucosamine-6-phosphate isomerase/deaminase
MQEYSNIEVFETEEALNKGMAELIIATAAKAIALRNRFVLCLSGGNTPQKLYDETFGQATLRTFEDGAKR